MYFKNLPKLLYSTSLGVKNFKVATNILAKTQFIKDVLENTDLYYNYDVKDNEKPEDIAYKFYGDSKRHWIILLANEITDPQYDWVLSKKAFDEYINKKYSSLELSLKTTESYPTGYTVGETLYQGGDRIDKSNTTATVVAYNSGTKVLQVKFPQQVFANGETVTGVTSAQTHTVVAVSYNNDGYNWSSNTTAYYRVTEVKYNNFDNEKKTNKYFVSASDYNFSTDAVVNRNTNTSYTNNYTLNDGSILTIETTVAPLTYYDYEVELNEEKRSIVLPRKEYVSAIEDQFKRLMRT